MIVVSENGGNANSLVVEGEQYNVTGVEIDEPNSVSIFLQVPMYVIMTGGEILFVITQLEFAFSQVSNDSLNSMIDTITQSIVDTLCIFDMKFPD